MNIVETHFIVEAKTSGYNKNKTISYRFIESAHSLCFDKREIILAQIEACERLSKFSSDEIEQDAIKKEISGLKLALDMTNY